MNKVGKKRSVDSCKVFGIMLSSLSKAEEKANQGIEKSPTHFGVGLFTSSVLRELGCRFADCSRQTVVRSKQLPDQTAGTNRKLARRLVSAGSRTGTMIKKRPDVKITSRRFADNLTSYLSLASNCSSKRKICSSSNSCAQFSNLLAKRLYWGCILDR